MYEEDKTVLSPKEEPEKPAAPEIPETPVMPTPEDATIMSDIPVILEIPASEDATVVSDEPIPFDIPVINEMPVTPEIPVMDAIPVVEVDPGEAPGGLEDPAKDWMAYVAIASGVLSLCGAVFAPLGCLFSIAAVVLGILGMKSTKRTLAIIGLAAGGLGVLLSLVFGIIWIGGLFFAESAAF